MSNVLLNIHFGILTVIDFIQFVYYAKNYFTSDHIIRLFYFDTKAYLDSKFIFKFQFETLRLASKWKVNRVDNIHYMNKKELCETAEFWTFGLNRNVSSILA